jgi:hypothetical protein
VNAGCSPDLGRARLYRHDGAALLDIGWLEARQGLGARGVAAAA